MLRLLKSSRGFFYHTKKLSAYPEAKKIRTDELEETQIAGGSMGEAVASGVASGVSCGIVTVMIPGPGIPG